MALDLFRYGFRVFHELHAIQDILFFGRKQYFSIHHHHGTSSTITILTQVMKARKIRLRLMIKVLLVRRGKKCLRCQNVRTGCEIISTGFKLDDRVNQVSAGSLLLRSSPFSCCLCSGSISSLLPIRYRKKLSISRMRRKVRSRRTEHPTMYTHAAGEYTPRDCSEGFPPAQSSQSRISYFQCE